MIFGRRRWQLYNFSDVQFILSSSFVTFWMTRTRPYAVLPLHLFVYHSIILAYFGFKFYLVVFYKEWLTCCSCQCQGLFMIWIYEICGPAGWRGSRYMLIVLSWKSDLYLAKNFNLYSACSVFPRLLFSYVFSSIAPPVL